MTSGKKISEYDVRQLVKDRGFTLVSYCGTMSGKSKFKCQHGHEWETRTINVTTATSGCPECSRIKKVRYSEQDISNIGRKRNISLVRYSGNIKSKSKFKCQHGHEWETSATNIIRGFGCPHCAGQYRYEIDVLREKLKPRHIDILKYAGNVKDTSSLKCTCGHVWKTKLSHILRGSGCPKCAGKAPRDMKSIVDALSHRNIKILKYSGDTVGRSVFQCDQGHEWESITSNVLHLGTGCPKCTGSGTSKGEQSLFDFVKSLAPDAHQSVRSIIAPQELDIVIPSAKVAIEFNGIWWHSERYRDADYHVDKRRETEQAGYRLISVREDLWNEKREQVENIIRNALGLNRQTVYARKCKVVTIDGRSASEFLNRHHVQGSRGASYYYGLTLDDTLVAVMSVTHWVKKNQWELVRYATSQNVTGGLSKLWKHIVKENKIENAFSYVDRDLFTGSSYSHAGFVYDSTSVGFRIVVGETTQSRQKWNRAPEGMTQNEWYEREGVSRMYDSGQDKIAFLSQV